MVFPANQTFLILKVFLLPEAIFTTSIKGKKETVSLPVESYQFTLIVGKHGNQFHLDSSVINFANLDCSSYFI
jgi:hypothetical protein